MTKANKSLKKSLKQLEKEFPNEVLPKEKLPLLPREMAYAKIPLEKFSVEHLCFMIMHGLGWNFLIPMAIEILIKNPFAEGEDIGYSLLGSVLSVKGSFWKENPDLYERVEKILQTAESVKTEEAETILTVSLPQSIYDFRKNQMSGNV